MTIATAIVERYSSLVEQIVFASDHAEAELLLAEAFDLGRMMIAENTAGSDQVLSLHHEALVRLGRLHPNTPLELVAERLTRPMMEVSMAYGLAYGLAFREHEDQLAAREREFRALVENSTDNIARFDVGGHLLYANPTLEQTLNTSADELRGKRLTEAFPDSTFAAYEAAILAVAATGKDDQIEQGIIALDGSKITLKVKLVAERDVDGEVVAVLSTGHDITDILYYQEKMHALAYIDALTGLPNRALFNDRIHHAATEAKREGWQLGLMLLDLDNFKTINDTLGHTIGDRLLHQVARRLEGRVRASDTVARLGGDEFVIILPKIRGGEVLHNIAGEILKTLTDPYIIEQHELFVSASIGMAVYPDDNDSIETLLDHADSAMYHAKKKGRNNYQFYSRELTARSRERMMIDSALRYALKRKELELHYQPQVDLVSGRIVGAEALLRWNRGEGGMVTPDRFIPVAEETGMIVSIGEKVLLEACTTIVAWNRDRPVPLKMAVNLSTRQFIKNDLVSSMREILAETGCRPEWIKLEITESLLLEDSDEVLAIMNGFAEMGLSIAIDDFGTGYSALGYLNRFPLSQIKIDRSFVQDIPADRDKAELVKALISIAKSLRLELVAEGVETYQQADYLTAHGCVMAQGYLFGRPMPREAFEALLNADTPALRQFA